MNGMKKGKIIAIGACVADTLVTVPHYPAEDTKLRAVGIRQAGGGPAATGLVAAAKLGCDTAFAGVLADDAAGEFLYEDFARYGVDTAPVRMLSGYRSFTSTVLLAADTATRTCVFDKGTLPPFSLTAEHTAAIADAALLMVDGNELTAAVAAAKIARAHGVSVLYDCGGLYEGVAELLSLTDYLIPSCEFALAHTGKGTVREAAKALFDTYSPRLVVITEGKKGGTAYDGARFWEYPATPAAVVDSNGSGDVFHGAFAAGLMRGYPPEKCCLYASAVAALKCTGVGARESIPDHETTLRYLKENGYEF